MTPEYKRGQKGIGESGGRKDNRFRYTADIEPIKETGSALLKYIRKPPSLSCSCVSASLLSLLLSSSSYGIIIFSHTLHFDSRICRG